MVFNRLSGEKNIVPQNTEMKTAWDFQSTQTETEAEVQRAGERDSGEELYHSVFEGLGPLLAEFRLHGFNRQVPVVNADLLDKLGQELNRNNTSRVESFAGRPFEFGWLNRQFCMIENFHTRVSADGEKWVSHVLIYNNDGSLGSTKDAQYLVQRVDDTLKRLIHVISTLGSVMDYYRTEVAPEAVTFTAVKALSQTARTGAKAVMGYAQAQWSENSAALPMGKGFFWDVSQYLRELSEQLPANLMFKQHKAPVTFTSATHYAIKRIHAAGKAVKYEWNKPRSYLHTDSRLMNFEGVIMPDMATETRTDPPLKLSDVIAGASKWTDKQKANARFLLAKAGNYQYLPQNIPHDPESILPDPGGKSLSAVTASLIRGLLWQWQQPAIKIVFACSVLSAKTKELKKIKPAKAPSGHEDEQMRDEMLAKMNHLLDADISRARAVLARMGDIQATLELQMKVFTARRKKQPDEFDDESLTALMSDIVGSLNIAIDSLEKALFCASEACRRDFSTAGELAEEAMITAATAREKISAVSFWLTGRRLDEYSRGARIARYLAGVLNEKSQGRPLSTDPDKVLSLLKKGGLLNGILSEGDPEGHLMATRLAGESDNASHGEQSPLMTPEQYVALEKGLVEHVVKWGQRNIASGVSRLIFELSFGAAEFSMKPVLMAWKVVKASIKIPYKIHQVNKHTMPGQDKPYGAIYDMLGKKLAQLGFGLLMSPVPGVIRPGVGAAAAATAFAYNKRLQSGEDTFSAIYGRVVNGEKSQQVKMTSAGGMGLDVALYAVSGVGARAITRLRHRPDGLPEYLAGAPEIDDVEYDNGLMGISDDDWSDAGNTENELSEYENSACNHHSARVKRHTAPRRIQVGDTTKVDNALKLLKKGAGHLSNTMLQKIITLDENLYNKVKMKGGDNSIFKANWLRLRNEINLSSDEGINKYLDGRLIIESYDIYKGKFLESYLSDSKKHLVKGLSILFSRVNKNNTQYVRDEAVKEFRRSYGRSLSDDVLNKVVTYFTFKSGMGNENIKPYYSRIMNSHLRGGSKTLDMTGGQQNPLTC
ncbi:MULTISPECIES: hypothetical protein [unclassified Serratia (in: enterobacteria)]|uniref:hypothetical protein n=1 Tax=unclassified Serratia (in: enterobacteria) TaxID=2647522 RepID=UPI003B42A2D4